jgi:hypothetical protein
VNEEALAHRGGCRANNKIKNYFDLQPILEKIKKKVCSCQFHKKFVHVSFIITSIIHSPDPVFQLFH